MTAPVFPLAAVVGAESLKLALCLNAIDPRIGGVLIEGPRGMAKSTLARGLADLLGGGPFVTLPLGASEERIVGTLDLDAALGEGRARFAPGVLAAADGGVLYVDEVNLLPDHLVDLLLRGRRYTVGLTLEYPMNYRHAFHAGNHADVFKHATLLRLAALLARKETPFAYLDSHSGVGRYDLAGDQASRTDEWRDGIGRLWALESVPAAFVGYREAVAALNPDGALRYYPGSPELMRQALRLQDRLLLNELHPEDGRLLKENMARDRRVAVHQKDGWLLPRALLPVPERRALLLIDPPFEKADELERCVKAVEEAIGRMRQTVIMLWYPIKDRRQLRRFHAGLQASGAPKLLNVELLIRAADDPTRLNGSGLAIVNPPWGLEEELRDLLPWLAEHLAQGEGSWRLDWLIAE